MQFIYIGLCIISTYYYNFSNHRYDLILSRCYFEIYTRKRILLCEITEYIMFKV
jgi:hypothetical protein